MGRCARNIVLVGDPRQLPQVVQGAHPGAAGLSCLDWLLGEHATVPPDRGILLPVTRRMHPDALPLRLRAGLRGAAREPSRHRPPAGRRHALARGRARISVGAARRQRPGPPAEIEAIRAAIAELTAGTWTDATAPPGASARSDIIVVAPYNAQVNALRAALPERSASAPSTSSRARRRRSVLVSMTASSIDEVPRGMEFLFSLNRINVAVSRAKALALVFASPRLLDARCTTVEQVRLVNTLCALPVASPTGVPA